MKFLPALAGLLAGIMTFAQSSPSSAPANIPTSAPSTEPATSVAPEAAPAQDPNAPLEFSGVIHEDGVTASELYVRAKLFFMQAFKDSKNVIEVDDKEHGVVAGKGTIAYAGALGVWLGGAGIPGYIHFTMRVMIKDGRIKYVLSDFTHEGNDLKYGTFGLITGNPRSPNIKGMPDSTKQKTWQDLKRVCEQDTKQLIADLKVTMAQPSKGTDNW